MKLPRINHLFCSVRVGVHGGTGIRFTWSLPGHGPEKVGFVFGPAGTQWTGQGQCT